MTRPPTVSAPQVTAIRCGVGGLMKKHRLALGLSQAALAARLGILQSNISGYELGITNPQLAMIYRLALALEVEVSDLLPSIAEVFDPS